MSTSFYTIGFCILWLLLCVRAWLMIGGKHAWQRHLVAIGAGVGAALIYLFGGMVGKAMSVQAKLAPPPPSSEVIRVSPAVPKQ
jgi:hypothetical protein